MKLIWVVIPLVLFGIMGIDESFADKWGYGESNIIEVQGIDYKISAEYYPDTVPPDGYEEGILTLRVFDRNSNQNAEDVTLRIEILRDDITLAKNLYFTSDGTIKITVQPNSECAEEQISQCTTYSRTFNDILSGSTYTADPEPAITGPLFDKPELYKIKIITEAMKFEDKILAEPLDFELSFKLGVDTYLSNNYKVHDMRIRGLMEYNIPYELDNGKITGVNVICTGASMVVSMDNLIPTTLTMTIPKSLMFPDSHDYVDFSGHNQDKFNILSENSESITIQIQIDESNAVIPIYFTSQGLHPSSWETEYCPFDRLRILEHPPKIQMKMGVSVEDVTCYGYLVKIFKSSDNSPACVKSSTAEKLIERGWSEYQFDSTIKVEDSDVVLRYNIQNAILHRVYESEGITLMIELEKSKQGTMTIEIPKNSLCIDGEWFVLIDGEETDFDEINNEKFSFITSYFPDDSKTIELVYNSIYKGMSGGCPIR